MSEAKAHPGNLTLAIAGAVFGAAAGVVGWLALEHYAGYAFDPAYFALLPGSLAGLLAVMLGKRPPGGAFAVPAVTLVAVLAGGYLSCWNAATLARQDSQAIAADTVPGYDTLATDEQVLAVDKVHAERAESDNLTPMSRLLSTWGLWYLLFGFLSVWIAHFILVGGNFPLTEGPPTGQA